MALGHSVVQNHGFGFSPWIGEVVDGVKKFYSVVKAKFHIGAPETVGSKFVKTDQATIKVVREVIYPIWCMNHLFL